MYDPKSDGKDRISSKIIAKTPGLVVPGVFLCEYIEKGNQSLKNSTILNYKLICNTSLFCNIFKI